MLKNYILKPRWIPCIAIRGLLCGCVVTHWHSPGLGDCSMAAILPTGNDIYEFVLSITWCWWHVGLGAKTSTGILSILTNCEICPRNYSLCICVVCQSTNYPFPILIRESLYIVTDNRKCVAIYFDCQIEKMKLLKYFEDIKLMLI